MKQSLALRFERLVHESLPKRREMMQVLKEHALDAQVFAKKGSGVKTVLEDTGRLTDFKGVYGFIENDNFVYVDESAYVIRRTIRQFKGNSKYQMKLAHLMISFHQNGESSFTEQDALKAMRKMKVVFMDIPDDLERHLTTLYLQCQFECRYNRSD